MDVVSAQTAFAATSVMLWRNYTQGAGSSSLVLCLVNTTLDSCGDVERRGGNADCKTDRKLAETVSTLTAD